MVAMSLLTVKGESSNSESGREAREGWKRCKEQKEGKQTDGKQLHTEQGTGGDDLWATTHGRDLLPKVYLKPSGASQEFWVTTCQCHLGFLRQAPNGCGSAQLLFTSMPPEQESLSLDQAPH